MINAVVVDDEPYALKVVLSLASKVKFLNITYFTDDAQDAVEYLLNNKVDLLFLDIDMPTMSGIELLDHLEFKPLIIFTTAYSEHAVLGFEIGAIDYLLKPFGLDRFLLACTKAQEHLTLLAQKQNSESSKFFFLKAGYDLIRIDYNELLYLESSGNYVTFNLINDKRIMTRAKLSEALSNLPEEFFVRVHRSYVVNRSKISKIERKKLYINQTTIPISNAYNI